MVETWLVIAVAMGTAFVAPLLEERVQYRYHGSGPIARVGAIVDHDLILITVGRRQHLPDPYQVARTFDGLRDRNAMFLQE